MNITPSLPHARVEPPVLHIERATVGRDVTVVAGDSHVTHHNHNHHHMDTALLRPRLVDRATLVPRRGIVRASSPASLATVAGLRTSAAGHQVHWGVQVFVGAEGSGRRTLALDALDEELPDEAPVFVLLPDWETAEVRRIPRSPGAGYLLDLGGEQKPLDGDFHRGLAKYAVWAADNDVLLTIVVEEQAWGRPLPTDSGDAEATPLRVSRVSRPDSREIARRRLRIPVVERAGTADAASRAAWLDDPGSVFAKLLTGDEPPGEGVRLAEIIRAAEGPRDDNAREQFLGWEAQLTTWFGSAGPDLAPRRALQIAAAFLDGTPAVTVLTAADRLLSSPELNWAAPRGGVLAGPDDAQRCADAGVSLEGGTASLARIRPGIETALIKHVWHNRPRLVPVMTAWLSEISAPGGPAATELARLSDALMATVDVDGARHLLDLIEQWLAAGHRQARFASELLDRLALHPRLGARIRAVLAEWAKSSSSPQRQRAVVAVCRGGLGRERERLALTRLRYVLASTTDAVVRAEAISVLREMAVDPTRRALTLESLVGWATAERAPQPGVFLALFEAPDRDADPAAALLEPADDEGEFVREKLASGWAAVWACESVRPRAAEVLGAWCDAAESGALPADAVQEVVGEVVAAYASQALGDELNRLIGGMGPVRSELRRRCVSTARLAPMPAEVTADTSSADGAATLGALDA